MKVKLKQCDACGLEKPIWKNHEGNRYCKYCWSCQKNTSQKPTSVSIPRVSAKRAKKDAEYSKLRERYLTENTVCKVNVAGCTIQATDVHHTKSGSDRGVYYLIQSTFIPTCRVCHQWIHNNPEQARILGYLK